MADIAFLLIIFFMLTITFTASRGLDFAVPPEVDTPEIDPIEAALVEVKSDGTLLVDRRPMLLDALLEYLRPRLEANPEKPVILTADSDASYGAMVLVLDELRQGREKLQLAEEIAIALPTEREKRLHW